jgi:hypothetical protein
MMKRRLARSRVTDARNAARIACLTALTAVTVGACADSEKVDDRAIWTDSAGVTMVHYPSLPSLEEGRIVLSPEPELIIGHEGAEPAYEFFRIVGVAHLIDGTLVIANAGTVQLRFFDSDGQFLRSIGQRGEGPGEFMNMRGLWLTGGDSLAVWDGGSSLSLFSPDGEFVRSARIAGTPFTGFRQQFFVRGVLRDGRVVGFLPSIPPPPGGEPHRAADLLAFKAFDDAQWDSVQVTPGHESFSETVPENPDRISLMSTTLGAYSFAAAAGSTVALVDAADFRIELYDPDGRLSTVISAALPDIPVTARLLDAHIESAIELFPPGTSDQAREAFRERIRNAPLASVLPKVRTVFVDSEDRIWVERFGEPGSHTSRWEVFERDGTWIGRIEMPDGFARGITPTVAPGFSVASERVSGVWLDPETKLETVRVYRIYEQGR